MWNVQKMRISGLASGMDTDMMVQNLMRAERIPLDRLYQQKQLIEWRRDAYRDITNTLRVFKEEYMDVLKSDTNMLSPNYFKKFTSTVTDELGKESNAVEVSGSAGAIEEELKVQVGQLAQANIWVGSSDGDKKITKEDLGKTLGELDGFKEFFAEGADPFQFTINKAQFKDFTKDTTLKELMAKVNGDEKANVTMRFNEITNIMEIIGKKTGADNTIRFSEGEPNSNALTTALGLTERQVAQDAKVIINETVTGISSNQFTRNGITYKLNHTTGTETVTETVTVSLRQDVDTAVDNIKTVTVSLRQDVDTAVDNIKTVVEEYNKIVDLLNTKVSEKYNKNFPPLTQEQREAMDTKDIEKWEEKAKTGLLTRDSLLQGILQDMRRSLSDPVDGVAPIAYLRQIGIDTSRDYKNGSGKLVITDERKLREALVNDPDGIVRIFTKTSDKSYSRSMPKEGRQERYNEQGLMHRLSDIINDNISTFLDANGNPGKLITKAGLENTRFVDQHQLNDDMKRLSRRMDDLERNLIRKENAYYSRFAAMEKALAQMQNQASSLLAQLGMGN